jgi:hypothetical protein
MGRTFLILVRRAVTDLEDPVSTRSQKEGHRPHFPDRVQDADAESGDETAYLAVRGDAASETMDIYTRVDREESREEYLNCIALLGL